METKKLFDTAKKKEKAVLVALATSKQPLYKTQEYLDELALLAETSGVETMHQFVQK